MKTIKEYIGCIVPIILLIAFIGLMFYFNGKNRKDNETEPKQVVKTEEYVYIDVYNTLHNNIYCRAIGKEPGELGSVDRGVMRVPIKSLTLDYLEKTCSRCISDADYEQLTDSIDYYEE